MISRTIFLQLLARISRKNLRFFVLKYFARGAAVARTHTHTHTYYIGTVFLSTIEFTLCHSFPRLGEPSRILAIE